MYVMFEGVRDPETLLRHLLRLTCLDVQYAPGIMGVRLDGTTDPDIFMEDPLLTEMDDTPDGFWSMDVVDDDYFMDRVESAYRRRGVGRRKSA